MKWRRRASAVRDEAAEKSVGGGGESRELEMKQGQRRRRWV
jgi:hypothetical protein